MILELKNLFIDENNQIFFDDYIDLKEYEEEGINPFIQPVHVFGSILNNAGTVELSYTAEFNFTKPCDRCCEVSLKEYQFNFFHPLIKEESANGNDEALIVDGDAIDMKDVVLSDATLMLPTKHLCKQDCKGLCSLCGINLNGETCNCSKKQIDPRLEILAQLIQ